MFFFLIKQHSGEFKLLGWWRDVLRSSEGYMGGLLMLQWWGQDHCAAMCGGAGGS